MEVQILHKNTEGQITGSFEWNRVTGWFVVADGNLAWGTDEVRLSQEQKDLVENGIALSILGQ